MKIRDKNLAATRKLDGVSPTTAQAEVGAPEVKPELAQNEAGSKEAKAALRALALDGSSDETQVRSKGGDAAVFGAKLQGPQDKNGSPMRKAVALGALGISMLGAAQPLYADVVFLDFNNGVKEIETARAMAAKTGEAFHLVRPDKAALESIFAKAEAGEIDISTLVLSGHSGGNSIWGDGPGGEDFEADRDDFKALKEKYPKAFDQVKHVFFMACYAGGKGNSAQWNSVFHNARAIVGFYGSGPASHRPASSWVIKNVEAALDALPAGQLTPQQALLKAKQIASLQGPRQTKFGIRLDGVHFQHGAKVTNSELVMEELGFARNTAFTPFFEATGGNVNPPTNHQSSPLRDFYNRLQEAVNHVEPGSPQMDQLQKDIQQTIRLIYFDNITKNVELNHRPLFDEANQELQALGESVQIPKDLKQLSRAEILELGEKLMEIGDKDYEAELAAVSPALLEIANTWLESTNDEFRLDFGGATSSYYVNSALSDLEERISLNTFSPEEASFVNELASAVDGIRDLSKGERKAASMEAAKSAIEGARERVGSLLEDNQSAVELPSEGASLKRNEVLSLISELRQEAGTMSEWSARPLNALADSLSSAIGGQGEDLKDTLVSHRVSQSESDVESLNQKLEAMGLSVRVPTRGEDGSVPDAKAVAQALNAVRDAITDAPGVPAALVEAVATFRAAMAETEPSALSEVQDIFESGLLELNAEVIPDNWITD